MRPANAFDGPDGQIYLPRCQTRPPVAHTHCQTRRRRVQVRGMLPAPSDFCTGLTLDNSLLRSDVARGQVAPVGEVLSLIALAQSLYVMTTITTRSMDRIDDCRRVWAGTAAVLDEVLAVWKGVQSDDPNVLWMLKKIEHYQSLALDRVEMFSVSEQQRLRHAKTRDADFGSSFTERHEVEPQGYSNSSSTPQHVYQIGKL